MAHLLDFYRGTGTDSEGRRLEELWAFDDDRMEEVHDFVQWLFPLPEPSGFNHRAPLLTARDIAAFHEEPVLREHLQRSFERFLGFLGLARGADGSIAEGPSFSTREGDVWAYPNHNWLRITRLLRSLRLLGLEPEARALYDFLSRLRAEGRYPISDDTYQYWTEAVEGLQFHR